MLRAGRIAGTALLVLAAACSGSGSPPSTSASTDPPAPTPTTTTTSPAPTTAAPTVPAAIGDLPGRLVVLDQAGNVVTMRADGTDEIGLTTDAGPSLRFSQPTWSPAGDRIAWTRVDGSGGGVQASVVTANVDGTGRTEAETPFPVFYMLWDPLGERVAYLHSGTPVLEMGILDVAAGGDEAATVDTGQPYYLSWSPAGDELLVHVGLAQSEGQEAPEGRLDLLDPSGEKRPLGPGPGVFQAPVWSARDRLVYASFTGDGQRLVESGPDGSDPRDLLRFEGFIWYVVNPAGDEIAFQVRQQDAPPAVSASFQTGPPPAPLGALSTLDVDSGALTTLTVDAAVAFFYSPQGTLASLHAEGDGWFRWRGWGVEQFTGPRFQPTVTMLRDYLPFFDQYAQSITPWSPDGSALVFAGRVEGERAGIWVLPAEPGAEPVRVAGGVFAAWSPG